MHDWEKALRDRGIEPNKDLKPCQTADLHGWWRKKFDEAQEYVRADSREAAVAIYLGHGEEGAAALRDGLAASKSPTAVAALEDLLAWAHRDGKIGWTLPPLGKARVTAMLPPPLARAIRIRAAEECRNVSTLLEDAATAYLAPKPAAAQKGGGSK